MDQKTRTVIPYDRALPEVPGRTPYTKPDTYLEKLGAGDYAVRQGRHPSTMFLVKKCTPPATTNPFSILYPLSSPAAFAGVRRRVDPGRWLY